MASARSVASTATARRIDGLWTYRERMSKPQVECQHCGKTSYMDEVPTEPTGETVLWRCPKCPDAEFEFNEPMPVNECLLGSWELKTDE